MNIHLKTITLSLLCWAISLLSISADPESKPNPEPAPEQATPEQAEKPETPGFEATEKEIKLPGVTIDRVTKEVRIDAEVCLDTGLLEYVVCRPDTFEHEAIFTTKAKPELVHAALLLCGLKPTPQLRGLSDLWSENALKQKLSRVKIEVEWQEKEEKKRVNLIDMIRDRSDEDDGYSSPAPDAEKKEKKETKVQDAWIFTGSFLHEIEETGKQFYAANSSGILVGIWPDPSTVIQYGIQSGDPYAADHLGMAINEDNVPKVGTKVKLVFSKLAIPEKKAEEKAEPKE